VLAAEVGAAAENQAEKMLAACDVKGGLVVHVGCGDGRLTAALRANDRYVVCGLDADPQNVRTARAHMQSMSLYGPVSIRAWRGETLPFADNLVNLLVVESGQRPPKAEMMRVLAPRGVALVRHGDRWTRTVKPWPAEMDEWTHFLHDASNNAVAHDSVVGPPRRLRWICGPEWSRSHEFTSSLCAMVSARGRIFYIFDHGLTGVTTKSLPERWTLIARDAFNGVLLWSRPVPKWGSAQWKNRALRSIPGTVPRRLVAQADHLYFTLGYDASVSVLDAATGETVRTYDDTAGTEEIRCIDETLILRKGRGQLMALDVVTGKGLWNASGKIRPLTLSAQDRRVFYQDGQQLVCRGARDGRVLWQRPCKAPARVLLVHDGQLVLQSKQELEARSAETGEVLWTIDGRGQRGELFVAGDLLWHWQGETAVGRDVGTGDVARRVDTTDVFTPGHHWRCYQSKATDRYLITPNRGAEFISLTGDENTQNDWARGPCRYGVMPCNGLLYIPPNPCFCYPGVKITGFNALAPADTAPRAAAVASRLERGPAYGQVRQRASDSTKSSDWPTYRHDGRRTGAAGGSIAPQVEQAWSASVGGELTPPVAAGGCVFVARKHEHTVYALDADDGDRRWRFTAGGRIDSPPTIHAAQVLFGCADGHVYCLHASNGELAWRFRAAPSERLIVADGQLESPWRVHGSVLIEDDVAYVTAGRSSHLDGGIFLFALDPDTGRVLHEASLDTWARTRGDADGRPFIAGYHMEGARSDILVSQDDFIYLGQTKFDRELKQQDVPYIVPDADDKTVAMDLSNQPYVGPDEEPESDYETHQRDWLERTQKHVLETLREAHGGYNIGHRQMGLHVFSTAGFLDDSWFNRTYWMYSSTWPGFYLAHRAAKTGQLLVVGPEKTYVVQAYPSRNLQSPLFTPGERGYLLYADRNDNEPILDHRTQGTTKGWGFLRAEPPVWHQWVPVRVRGMALAGQNLFIAGPPDVVDPDDPMAAFEGRKGGLLWAVSASDGTRQAGCRLESPPVFDGLIAAQDRLFLSLRDGRVICMQAMPSHTMAKD
jgi:outer membrane protein assembly factor BamB